MAAVSQRSQKPRSPPNEPTHASCQEEKKNIHIFALMLRSDTGCAAGFSTMPGGLGLMDAEEQRNTLHPHTSGEGGVLSRPNLS